MVGPRAAVTRARVWWAVAVAAVAAAGIAAVLIAAGGGSTDASLHPSGLPQGVVGKPAATFTLQEHTGRSFRSRDLTGRPYIVTFLYTRCPDVCPLIGQEIRQAFAQLGQDASRVAALAVSVDPRGDTPGRVREWLHAQRLPGNFHYLLGSRRELAPVWEAFYVGPQLTSRARSLHTASVWVIDANGRIATKFSGGAPFDPSDLADDLRALLT